MSIEERSRTRPPDPGSTRTGRTALALFLGGALVTIFVLNLYAPRLADDYRFAAGPPAGTAAPAADGDAAVGGGPLGATAAAALVALPRALRAAVDTAALALLIALASRLARRAPGRPWRFVPAAVFLLWFGTPGFGESFLWATGSGRSLWPGIAMLALLVPFARLAEPGGQAEGRTTGVAAVLLAPLVGTAGSELWAPALVLAGWFLVAARRRRRPAWVMTAAVVLAVSVGASLVASGVRSHAGSAPSPIPLVAATAGPMGWAGLFLAGLGSLWPLWLALVAGGWLARRTVRDETGVTAPGRGLAGAYTVAAVVSVACGTSASAHTLRALTPAALLLTVAAASVVPAALAGSGRWRSLVVTAALVAFGASAVAAVREFRRIDAALAARAVTIARARDLRLRDVALPPVAGQQSRAVFLGRVEDISYDPAHWTNRLAARAWGLGTVRLIPAGLEGPLVDLAETVDVPLTGRGVVTGVLLAPRQQCLVVQIDGGDPRPLAGGTLDVRLLTDRSSPLRRLAERVRSTLLPASARGGWLDRLALRLTLERLELPVTATSLSCVRTRCRAFLPLPDAARRVDVLYLGWRPTPAATAALQRVR